MVRTIPQVGAGTIGHVPSLTAATLFRQVDLLADGPVQLGRPVPASGARAVHRRARRAARDRSDRVSLVGKWIERVPDLTLDGERPTSNALAARLVVVLAAVTSGSSTSGRRTARSAAASPRWTDRPGRPPAGQRRALAQDPAHARDDPGLVGADHGHRGIRGRGPDGVRRGGPRRGTRRAARLGESSCRGRTCAVRPVSARRPAWPCALLAEPRGARTSARADPDRQAARRRGRWRARRGASSDDGRAPGRGVGKVASAAA